MEVDQPLPEDRDGKAVDPLLFEEEEGIDHLPDHGEEAHIAFSDHTACREVFGQVSSTDLNEGLRRMADWVHEVGARESSRFENVELNRNLPSSWR